MKRYLLSLVLLCSLMVGNATTYYRASMFPIDGATVRDSFLIVVHYSNNTYIWNGQDATGKNYVCLQNTTPDIITGNYADNEVAFVHNQYHDYKKQFSVLCKGDGDRDDKGGYYLAGVGGNNGITFNAGQTNAEITFSAKDGVQIATKSGKGIFRFNITPNDPHGFKFYEHDTNMLLPMLFVKGPNTRYTTLGGETSITMISAGEMGIVAMNGTISNAKQEPMHIYNLAGQDVTARNGQLSTGVYIVRIANTVARVMMM